MAKGPLQRLRDKELAEANARPAINAFTAQHGIYETGVNRHMINRGGTPVARWRATNVITDAQMAAIEHCWKIWAAIDRSGGLVMDLDRVRAKGAGDGWAEQRALDDMRRIRGYFPKDTKWFDVFENVCRFDEPAGVAGSKLCRNKDEHVASARATVQFVADIIANNERLSY